MPGEDEPAARAMPGASFSIQPPEPFDFTKPHEWTRWIRRFERFRQASNLSASSDDNQLTDTGKAAKGGIAVGDLVLSIDGISTEGMNHLEAQNKIKNCAGDLSLTLQKAPSVPKPPPPVAAKTHAGPGVTNGPHSILKVPRKHVTETDIHFYHVPSHGDASRKRIMEDTEDWRPRSGTTQSRSFRILAQITGTENPPEAEAEDSKKAKGQRPVTPRLTIGPKYHELRDWHHGVSARTLNVQ